MTATTTTTDESLWRLKLQTWLSPAFPVGGFAFSGGLEWAEEAGAVRDAAGLLRWLGDLLLCGAPRVDAVLLAAAWRAPGDGFVINDLALALAPSAERRLEMAAQGTAFRRALAIAWPDGEPDQLGSCDEIAYPIAVGSAARRHTIPLRPTLEAFTLAGVAALVSAALRLGIVGQSEAQRTIAGTVSAAIALAGWAEGATLADCGSCTWAADIASMRHERQYSRLFRS